MKRTRRVASNPRQSSKNIFDPGAGERLITEGDLYLSWGGRNRMIVQIVSRKGSSPTER